MAHILEVKDLRYSYGGIQALRGIDLHIGEKEVIALIGTNGAGKTTTLQCISGLLGAPSGVCTIMVGRIEDWLREVMNAQNILVDPYALDMSGVAVFKQAMAAWTGELSSAPWPRTALKAPSPTSRWSSITARGRRPAARRLLRRS